MILPAIWRSAVLSSPITLKLMEENLSITRGTVSPYGEACYPSLLKYNFDCMSFSQTTEVIHQICLTRLGLECIAVR